MTSTTTEIRQALESQVTNISGVPAAAQRAWENVEFSPTTGTSWIRLTFSPTVRRPQDINAAGLQRYDGLFLIDLFLPLDGKGPDNMNDLLDATLEAFEAGTALSAGGQDVMIEYAEPRGAAVVDAPWFTNQVMVKWKAFN